MGWQSDWLYQGIFHRIEALWHESYKDGAALGQQPPDRFVIEECATYTRNGPFCLPPAVRRWEYAGGVPILLPADSPIASSTSIRGVFHAEGRIGFHITADRRHVIWNHFLGPRYARALGFRVVGQGSQGRLDQDIACGSWSA